MWFLQCARQTTLILNYEIGRDLVSNRRNGAFRNLTEPAPETEYRLKEQWDHYASFLYS